MTKKLTKPIAFLSAVAMLMTMLLYLPSSVFSDMGLGLSANAETITPTEPSTDENGVYQIGTAAELCWFAELVNGTLDGVTSNSSANAKLMNDITVNEDLLASLEYDSEGNVTNGASFSKWTPIGMLKPTYQYNGTFDGNGKTVSGLFFDSSTTNYAGLFGYIGSGKVTGVKVADSYIRGQYFVGGVCGRNESGEITNCSNSGKIVGTEYVGGVCGNNYENAKAITDCYNEGTVIGTGNYIGGVCGYNYAGMNGCYNTGNVSGNWYVGGVCGTVSGEVLNCYNTGDISATGSNVGGVCGATGSNSKLTNCYNTGNITSTVEDKMSIGGVCGDLRGEMTDCYNTGKVSTIGQCVGGVCGWNSGTIKNCYNLGDVSGKTNIGGVCGLTSDNGSVIMNCYSLGEVSGSSNVGGVCGNNGGAIANCYFNSTKYTGEAIGRDFSGNSVNVLGKAAASFTNGEVAYLLSQGHTVDDTVYDGSVWGQDLETDAYPVLNGTKVYQNEMYSDCVDVSVGLKYIYANAEAAAVHVDHVYEDGKCLYCKNILPQAPQQDSEGVYQITNAEELYWFAGLVNGTLSGVTKNSSANAILMNDITVNENLLASLEYDADGNVTNGASFTKWVPISDYSSNIWSDYKGTFNGNGKTISGLFCDNSTTNYIGLFGYIYSGKVTDVKVADSYIRGNSWVGGVCGRNDSGEITNCGNSGKVVGTDNVGGVCGYNDSSAKDLTGCYNEGTVIGSGDYVGGVCGENYVGISGCYNTGSVSGDWSVGGVCGVVYGEVLNCYNTGDISGSGKRVGGVCGYTNSANATITNCYNTGSVITSGDNVGGVCGDLSGEMTGCYNTGSVSGSGSVGGVCGRIIGTVKNCYNLGDVNGSSDVGGVCGLTGSSSMTVNCYSFGGVSGSSNVGGVCGNNGGALANCYFNSTEYTGEAVGDDFSGNSVNVSGKAASSFSNGEVAYLLAQGHTVGETVYDGSVWGQTFGSDYYPVIGGAAVYQNEAYAGCVDAPGEMTYVYANTEAEPSYKDHEYIFGLCKYCEISVQKVDGVYQITNAAELYWFADHVNSGNTDANAKLMNNITVNSDLISSLEFDAAGDVTNGDDFTSWTPIGWYDSDNDSDYSYTGTFDGQGFTISGLYFNDPARDGVGLFGHNCGTVKNVCVVDSYFHGCNYVGGVCGYNREGSIEDCDFSGMVSGEDNVGGILGNSYGGSVLGCTNTGSVRGNSNVGGVCGRIVDNTIGYCSNTGSVSGNIFIGGVCGDAEAESPMIMITECFNTGEVNGIQCAGGVCGLNGCGYVANCYNTGAVTATGERSYAGGVCGLNGNGYVANCYNTGEVTATGVNSCAGGVCGFNSGGIVANCYNTGAVTATGVNSCASGVCGINLEGIVANCYNTGAVTATGEGSHVGGLIGGNAGKVENCYFLKGSGVTAISENQGTVGEKVLEKTTKQFNSGEVAYLLSQGCTIGEGEKAQTFDGSAWGQKLGTDADADAYPVFSTHKVYKNELYSGCIHEPGTLGYVYENVENETAYASFTEVTDKAVPATCTTDGKTAGSHCSVCGAVIVAQETVKATGHSYTTKVVAPTYAAKGYTLHTCSKCGDSYKDTYTAKLTVPNVAGLKMTSNATNSISMSWNKVSGATGYVVYQAIDGKWQRIKVTSGNTLTVSNLKAGTNYRFTVKAYKTVSGTNYYSPSYTGVWMTTLPAKPSAKMTVNTPQAIRLEWGKVTGATGYVVYKMEGGKWVKKAVTSGNVYVFTNLASGTNYNFAVRAYRTFNGKNYYSPFATATDTIKTCTKPATVNFTLTAGTKKATVNWSKVTGATGYIVYYKTSANGSWQRLTTTKGTTYTKTGLTTGKTYYFTVKAYKTYNGKTYNASFTTKSVKVK